MDTPGRAPTSDGPTHQRVAENVRMLRQRRGLGQAELSKRLATLGTPLGVSALSKIENGTRRVTVDDLVALAIALDVSPNRLLLTEDVDPVPASPEIRPEYLVALTPSVAVDRYDAWQWAVGSDPLRPDPCATEPERVDLSRTFRFKQENQPHDPPGENDFEAIQRALEEAKERKHSPQELIDKYGGLRLISQMQRYPEIGVEIIESFDAETDES
jgi:transcriptional regulator with XRE-family HTH domain